jgi:gamma-glutamylcyclotransferase (GGCT)/AIG2-like uncharacterized protein YtfP
MICGRCGGSGWLYRPGNKYKKCCSGGVIDMRVGSLLFVYGTLRRGERADLSKHEKEFGVTYLGEDRINGLIYNMGSYPGLKVGDPLEFDSLQPSVVGDVFRIENKSIITLLDHYEGYPYLYNRTEVPTEGDQLVWVYTYNGEVSDGQLLPAGDWINRPTIRI